MLLKLIIIISILSNLFTIRYIHNIKQRRELEVEDNQKNLEVLKILVSHCRKKLEKQNPCEKMGGFNLELEIMKFIDDFLISQMIDSRFCKVGLAAMHIWVFREVPELYYYYVMMGGNIITSSIIEKEIREYQKKKSAKEEQGLSEANSVDVPKVTNQGLLEICFGFFDGEWCGSNDERVSIDTILNIALKCKEYLSPMKHELFMEQLHRCESASTNITIRPLALRQIQCGIHASHLLGKKSFVFAMNEFMNCIDNFGSARREVLAVSLKEYELYICILELFTQTIGFEKEVRDIQNKSKLIKENHSSSEKGGEA